jgi:ABC-type nitrate/sulfonate/bicarbonate transport system substrate-binding protein
VKNAHYMSIVTTRKKLAADRDAYVRLVAALVDAQRFMSDPKNLDKVAADAGPTGRSAAEAKWSLQHYLAMDFWPKDSGLSKPKIEVTIKAQAAVHGIRPGATPVTYERYADESDYKNAMKLVK